MYLIMAAPLPALRVLLLPLLATAYFSPPTPPPLNQDMYDPESTEEHKLEDIDIKQFGKVSAGDAEEEEEDDDGRGGPGGVQCQQS